MNKHARHLAISVAFFVCCLVLASWAARSKPGEGFNSKEPMPRAGLVTNEPNSAASIAPAIKLTPASGLAAAGKPVLRLETDPHHPGISFLSWDTEGGMRARTNLLRPGSAVTLRLKINGRWIEGNDLAARALPGKPARYQVSVGDGTLEFTVRSGGEDLELSFRASRATIEASEIVFPFDPGAAATTILPAEWRDDGTFRLPGVLNAPDFGPLVVRESANRPVLGRLEGSREKKYVNLILELPPVGGDHSLTLTFRPLLLPPPRGLKDAALWTFARRGWLNALQPCSQWGEQNRPFSAPAGILGNNVISDPASVSIWFYADQALWMPEIAPGVSVTRLVANTIDYWLTKRMRHDAQGRETGEITGYWDFGNFLDANASPLIAAWDYVEASHDLGWLGKRIERLEFVAEFLAKRDVDHDGFVEATQSGNRGTLRQPARSCAWWDALNCGYKDGYTNALIYRGWRCLADLEAKLGRKAESEHFGELADRLKAVYAKTLFNPATGWLAWWKSEDGELHDYASPTLNGLAIEYGLVEPGLARQILDRLWAKIDAVGFTRFDLGVPPMLIPVPRSDYLQPDAIGIPQREDGTDTFGQYMNGGITAGHVLHFLAAHYVLGEPERADKVLRAMLGRQMSGRIRKRRAGHRHAGDRLDDLGRQAERLRRLSRRQFQVPPGDPTARALLPRQALRPTFSDLAGRKARLAQVRADFSAELPVVRFSQLDVLHQRGHLPSETPFRPDGGPGYPA